MSVLSKFSNAPRAAVAAALAAMVLAAGASPASAALDQPVRIDAGEIEGVPARDASVTVFKGIPYAAPPVGPLRWRAPQPATPWTGVRKADHFGATCPQAQADSNTQMDEDCLFLNVWTGAASSAERRPVLVWIYGGAFSMGSGSNPLYDGAGLARKGLVVVTFNYRLGALGFLATPELSRESGHNASGDYGLLDDIAVLKWVKQNIAAFGGDPNRVMIAGQSAGAGSVGFLAESPLARGLFQRAIAESHARYPRDLELRYLSTSWRSLASAENAGVKFAEARGAHSLEELRAMPWQKLIAERGLTDETVYTGSSAEPPYFRPVVDGWVLPFSYSQTYAKGAQADVPFIAGNNHDESGAVPETAFAPLRANPSPGRPGEPSLSVTLKAFVSNAQRKFGKMAGEFFKLYPASDDAQAALQNNASVHDNSRVSTFLWARLWKRSAKSPVYTYFWNHAPPGPDHDRRGAYHGSEIHYVFDNLYSEDLPWTDEDRRVADIMSSYWVNFATNGNPNGKGLPAWPEYDPKSPRVMELGDHFGPIPVASPARMDFWRRFFDSNDAW